MTRHKRLLISGRLPDIPISLQFRPDTQDKHGMTHPEKKSSERTTSRFGLSIPPTLIPISRMLAVLAVLHDYYSAAHSIEKTRLVVRPFTAE